MTDSEKELWRQSIALVQAKFPHVRDFHVFEICRYYALFRAETTSDCIDSMESILERSGTWNTFLQVISDVFEEQLAYLSMSVDQLLMYAKSSTKIYLMLDTSCGWYKIGRSQKPSVREKTLLATRPTIELIQSWSGRDADETILHEMFADKRGRGEWFNLDRDDIEKIGEYFDGKE